MTISDKIRIYELSRDLNLENKDILDAAQKLSISVKSHSSSISAEEAKKIKNLINKKNSDKKILSIKKPSIKKENYKQNKENESSVISSMKGKPLEDNSKKKPLLIKPLNKPENQKIISNKPTILNKPTNTNSSQSRANLSNKNINSKPSQNLNQDKKTFANNTTPPIKSPAKPPIQLIAKPKNINNNVKSNESSQNISSAGDKRLLSNKPDQNTNNPTTKIFNNRIKTPELVGAPIRRKDPKINPNKQNNNKQNIAYKQNVSNRPSSPNRPGIPNRPGMPNRPGLRNKPSDQGRPGSFNRQGDPNRVGSPNRPGMPNNRPGSKFNGQNSSRIRKPVSPNELLQLQKNINSEKDNLGKKNNAKQNIDAPKQKANAPNSRPNATPSSKKTPHRAFSNSSKKPLSLIHI